MRVEQEYVRCDAWAYLTALNAHRAKAFGRCERKTGIASFERPDLAETIVALKSNAE